MKITLLLSLLSTGLLVSCASNTVGPYHPATPPEQVELDRARLSVYPDEVRKELPRYANARVAWAGIIVTNDATDDESTGKIRMNTLFEDHYFDWEQKGRDKGARLAVSPRGEGLFRMTWSVSPRKPEASPSDANIYAAPGNLAIVYGTPDSVETNGTIDLRYHFIRVFEPSQFTTNELDYGRLGGPIEHIANPKAPTPPPSR